MPWLDQQAAFAGAVRNPASEPPQSIQRAHGGQPAHRRFAVYRNNHVLSLIDALASRFPVVQALTGEDFFREMARAFVLSQPPSNPVLIHYGGGLSEFIRHFEPAASLPFLADLADLEWSIAQSYHAADAEPCAIAALAEAARDTANGLRLTLHPSLRLIASSYPVFSIWSAHQGEDGAVHLGSIALEAEAGVVVRPGLDVNVTRLVTEAHQFLASLATGATLEVAASEAGLGDQAQLAGLLGFVFEAGLIAGVSAIET